MDYDERRRRTSILQTRGLVSLAVLLLIGITDSFGHPALVASFIVVYAVLTVLLSYLSSRVVRLRRIQAALDLIAVSLVVWSTGGIESSWFLLYLFPILSVARHLGARGSLIVTAFAMLGYGIACSVATDSGPLTIYRLGFRAAVFGAAALTAASLSRARNHGEMRLVRAIEEINHAILADAGVKQVMRLILNTAMEITGSESSAIRLADGTEVAMALATHGSGADHSSTVACIVNKHYHAVRDSRKTLQLPPNSVLAQIFTLDPRDSPEAWAALLVPLTIGDTCLGVLGVFSRRLLHYTRDDVRRVMGLAHLIAMAQKNAELYAESRARLQILYEVGERLRSEQSLDMLFQNVVRLVSAHLGSEEAALFLLETGHSRSAQDQKGTLGKVAVEGPNDATRTRLMELEQSYPDRESLIGGVFESKQPCRDNSFDPNEPYAATYAEHLPSRVIRHYMGAPLLIGDEVLGVIRVLNKKAKSYSAEVGAAHLAEEGFGNDDLALLSAIATQVASAIRNARFVEQHVYFRNLVYNSPYPIIVIDKYGRIRNFNRESEKLWGISEEAVLDTPLSDYYESPDHAMEVGYAVWEAASRGEGVQDYSVRIRKAGETGGEIIPARLVAAGFLDKDGQHAGSIGIFTDEREVIRATEEKIRNEQLAALGRIAHAKGHDIKHDIGTIQNWTDILMESARGDPDTQQACSAIEAAMSRALAKLQDMLMAADPKPPNMNLASLRKMLAEFEVSIMHEVKATRVDFRLRYPEQDHLLLADVDQMRQLFTNLFSNSLDAIKRARELHPDHSSGRIELEVMTAADALLLSWCDDGSGMSEEVRAKAFTPLFTTKKTGSGLGLFIAKIIVESHGGRIDVEPGRGGGAQFTIQLPCIRTIESTQTIRPQSETFDRGADR